MNIIKRIQIYGIKNTAIYIYNITKYTLLGAYIDLRYGKKLCSHKKEINYKDSKPCMPSPYHSLQIILTLINDNDIIVDIGCGEGRIINYLLSKKIKNPIKGIEIDSAIAIDAAQRYKKHQNIQIIQGDAIENLPQDGTIFLLYNPFGLETMRKFEMLMRNRKDKPIKILYFNHCYLEPFKNNNWKITIKAGEKDYNYYRVAIITSVNDFLIIS